MGWGGGGLPHPTRNQRQTAMAHERQAMIDVREAEAELSVRPLSAENIRWFDAIREWITKADEAGAYAVDGVCPFPLWDQEAWQSRGHDASYWRYSSVRPACGATFCQAGYIAEQAGGQWISSSNRLVEEEADREFFPEALWGEVFDTFAGLPSIHVELRAQRLLGITYNEAQYLFLAPTDLDECLYRLDVVQAQHTPGAEVLDRDEWMVARRHAEEQV